MTILKWIVKNRDIAFKAVCGLAVAILLSWGITLNSKNKKLSEGLEMAQNNIEAYQGLLDDSQQANNVLKLDIETLQDQNDKTLQKLDSVRKELKIKSKHVSAAATQTQVLDVNKSKGVQGDLLTILKDTVYNDSIQYNDLTKVNYTIGKDTVSIGIKLQNEQFLYIYNTREYKNKKNFFQRLFTLDFKKVTKTKYEVYNTNDLVNTGNVRVVVSNK